MVQSVSGMANGLMRFLEFCRIVAVHLCAASLDVQADTKSHSLVGMFQGIIALLLYAHED